MDLLGYLSALLIGISLAMIGSGGSILTVPALVYLFDIAPVTATAYSLFIVGSTSLVGGIQKLVQRQVDLPTVMLFGIPSILAVFLTRMYLVPAVPDVVSQIAGFTITKNIFIMIVFAAMMLMSSYSMITSRNVSKGEKNEKPPAGPAYLLILLEGSMVGVLTGFVGAGGGFLIIPALVLLRKLPMKIAIGTSLVIIAAKSLVGFTGDLSHMSMDWNLLGMFTLLSVSGIFAGNRLSKNIQGDKLRKGFGWFILVMSVYIFLRETLLR